MPSARARNILLLVSVFAGYVVLGKLGVVLGPLTDSPGAVWPPSGFALATVILAGRHIWPAILAGAIFVHFSESANLLTAIAIGAGNTLEAIVGAALVERYAGGANAFLRTNHIFRFTAIAALASAPLSASIAATTPMLAGREIWADYPYFWMTFWLGSLSGILVFAPLMLLWATTPMRLPRVAEVVEGVGLLLLLAGVGMVVFGGYYPSDVKTYPLEFLCVPFFLWASFRFGRRDVSHGHRGARGARGVGHVPWIRSVRPEHPQRVAGAAAGLHQRHGGDGHRAGVDRLGAQKAEVQLHELAITDPLTGLVNYRRLLEVMRTEIARSNRSGRPFAVLFVDMNGLKLINDQYGHLVGSRALCRVADVLRKCCRATDTAARFGGDEFALILPETGDVGGRLVLERAAEAARHRS